MNQLAWLAIGIAPALGAQSFALQTRSLFDPPPATAPELFLDWDGDGDLDALCAGAPAQRYRNEGRGRYVLDGTADVLVARDRTAVGDLDGDGDLDLASIDGVWNNDGQGTFTFAASLAAGTLGPSRVAAADADGDGDLDLFVLGSGLRCFENDGNGAFTDASASAFSGPLPGVDFTLLDADADGDPDVFVFDGFGCQLLRNDGAGLFTPEPQPTQAAAFFAQLRAGDFDGDHATDVWLWTFGGVSRVLLNDGAGAFQDGPDVIGPAGNNTYLGATTADWDQNGHTDIVGGGGVHLFGAGAASTFVPFPHLPEGSVGQTVDVDGDLDADYVEAFGGADLIVRPGYGSLHLPNRPAAILPPVFDRFHGRRLASERRGDVDLLVSSAGRLRLVTNSGDSQHGYRPLRTIEPAVALTATDAALATTRVASPRLVIAACTAGGPVLLRRDGAELLDVSAALLPVIGATGTVAAGQLDGTPGDELVFGGVAFDGPRILTSDAQGVFHDASPTLPPATSSTKAIHETVVVADLDGDGNGDLVHEQRILLGDGIGGFQLGPDLAALTSTFAQAFVPIDYDQDGDLDLFVHGAGAVTQLLRNDGQAFVDATIGTIPPASYAPCYTITVADLDADGDADALLARSGRSDVLRNDGGVFAYVADAAPAGVLVDTDDDGRADALTSDGVFTNLRTNLFAPLPALPGTDWRLELRTWRRTPSLQVAVVAIGTRELPAPVAVPGIGDVFVDLTSGGLFPVAMQQGRGEHTCPIPPSVLLLNTTLVAQGVVVDGDGIELTGAVRDVIL